MMGRIIAHVTAGSDDAELQLRAQTLLWFSAIMVLLGVGWGLGHVAYGNLRVPIVAFAAVTTILAAWTKLWIDRDLRFACHAVFATTFLASALGAFWTGGLRLTNISPFFLLMVAPVFLLGRTGVVWSAVALAVPLGFQIAHGLGFQFPDVVPAADRELDAALSWISAAVMVFLFALTFELARRRAAERLQLADRAKSAFLANVSHELRSPVHAIDAVHDQLASTELTDEQAELLASARDQVGGLYGFLTDLLDLAAAERGRFALETKVFSLAQTIRGVTAVTERLCRAKNLEFESEFVGLADHVTGDPRRIRQVLTNLCSNAVKFTERGRVSLAVEMSPREEGLLCRFEVSDTGIGISEEDQQRIFESFVQVQGPWASEGTGLGLSITHDLVGAMGGTMSLSSSAGRGTTVTVELPIETAAAEAEQHPAGRRLKVLVADDEPLNRQFLETVLLRLGHEPLFACDAAEAVSCWQSQQPDVVLMDLRMPKGGGLKATREIRAQGGTSTIVGLTGHATPETRAECLDAGMDDCLFKPFTAEGISERLSRER